MIKSRSLLERAFDLANYSVLIFLTVLTIYPLLHIIFASISDGYQLMAHSGLLLWPRGFSLTAYKMVFRNPMILRGYGNTLFMVLVGTALNVLLTGMGAYVLSRKRVYWQKVLMTLVIIPMFFQGGIIPFYLQVRTLKLYNSLWSLILAFAINGYNLIIMRTYFIGIPDSLEESAKMDGANDFTILFRIIFPVAKPVVATMILFYGVSRWNGYFYAMIFLRDRIHYPLALILREILVVGSTSDMMTGTVMADTERISDSIKFATAVIATVPILCIYPFMQRYFVKGAMVGALKE